MPTQRSTWAGFTHGLGWDEPMSISVSIKFSSQVVVRYQLWVIKLG